MIKENSLNSRERALRPGESISISILGDYFALTKPRLLFIVLMSTLIGYLLPAEKHHQFYSFPTDFRNGSYRSRRSCPQSMAGTFPRRQDDAY